MSEAPRGLSVVVPSVNGWESLAECLAALEGAGDTLEVLVPDRVGPQLQAEVARRFPAVRVLPAPAGTSIPDLRALGFEAATGQAIAVIEDHVIVPPGWAPAMLRALEGREVVGGAVANAATESLVDRAAFLCEYSHLIPPLPAGEVPGLTGNNTVYRAETLRRFRATWRSGQWESALHAAMRQAGVRLVQEPGIVVGHRMHYTVGQYAGQRYLYSRSFAGARVRGAPLLKRLAFGAAALALPAVVFGRVVRTVWRKAGHRADLVRSLPLLAVFATAWGLGEVVGYWFGPGDALSRVR